MKMQHIAVLFTLRYDSFRAAEKGAVSVKNTEWLNMNCLEEMLQYCQRIVCNHPRKAAVMAGSSIRSLCFVLAGNWWAGRERRQSLWHTGQRCYIGQRWHRHPCWGITPHIAAGCHSKLHSIDQYHHYFCAFYRCAHLLSSGNSQRSFMQSLMRYWQIPFQQWVQSMT